jgi:hypothetical protein
MDTKQKERSANPASPTVAGLRSGSLSMISCAGVARGRRMASRASSRIELVAMTSLACAGESPQHARAHLLERREGRAMSYPRRASARSRTR